MIIQPSPSAKLRLSFGYVNPLAKMRIMGVSAKWTVEDGVLGLFF